MCGIVGCYYFNNQRRVNEHDIKVMADQIVHRGPDDSGYFISNNVGLGMRRLSVIDLTSGHQPIFNGRGDKVIVFNGEVYNYEDHRPDLKKKGHQFKTKTDTEVVLHLYEELGLQFFEKLNGMFGLAIWDGSNHELLLARDRVGIKSLYYFLDKEKIVFASEIKSILSFPSVHPQLNIEGLAAFLRHGFTPAPLTLFKNIHKIPPANYLRISNRKVELQTYWHLSYSPKHNSSEQVLIEKVYELLKSSVKYRMIADVPLGAFLSSGLDSSGIVHAMSELAATPINSYSIGFGKGFEFYNELEPASKFAYDYKTNHNKIVVEPDVVELFPKLIRSLDEPLADSSFIVTYLISKLARKNVTVILSGVGGDELFGGYRRYLNISLKNYASLLPKWLSNHLIPKTLSYIPVDRNNSILNYVRLAKAYFNSMNESLEHQYATYTSVFRDDLRRQIMVDSVEPSNFYTKYFNECDSSNSLDKLMYFDLKTSLPEQLLMLSDKMSMATSLELRVPFLDHRLVEFVAKLPMEYKIKGTKLRYLQKKIFEPKFPGYVMKQKKKGFGAPIGSWIRKELKELTCDYLGGSYLKSQGIFNAGAVQQTLDNHFQMKEDYTDPILALITFQIWYEQYLKPGRI